MATQEVVLVPPTPADISQLALLADLQYLEPMGSEALNRKFLGIVPRGVYRGFLYSLPGGMTLRIGANNEPGTAIVESNLAAITVQQVKTIDLTVPANFDGYVVLEATYGVGVITKQVSTSATVDAARLKLVARAQLLPGHIIIYAVTTPPGLVTLAPSHINADERMDIDLAGEKAIDGGRYVNTPMTCKIIRLRRGQSADRLSYQLLDGELAVNLDTGRVTLGYGNRSGGTLQPAAKWAEAAGATAEQQGAYQFGAAGVLLLHTSGVVVGEHVRVRVAPSLLVSGAVCQVKVVGGAAIATRLGDALAVRIDVSDETVFVMTATGWGC